MTLTDKIIEAINADLPAATAGELQKFIAQAEADKKALAVQKETNGKLVEDNRALNVKVTELQGLKDKEYALDQKEKSLIGKELALTHKEEILKLKESNAAEKVGICLEVTRSVFQNNRFKYNMNTGYSDTNNGYSPDGSTNESRSGSSHKTIEMES